MAEQPSEPTYGNGLCACGHLSNDHACDHEASDRSCFKCECEAFRRPPAPAASSGAPRQRSIAELRGVVSMLCHFIWHRKTRPGDHLWSIPVDPERDFDCILTDAIDELEKLRAASSGAPPQDRVALAVEALRDESLQHGAARFAALSILDPEPIRPADIEWAKRELAAAPPERPTPAAGAQDWKVQLCADCTKNVEQALLAALRHPGASPSGEQP